MTGRVSPTLVFVIVLAMSLVVAATLDGAESTVVSGPT